MPEEMTRLVAARERYDYYAGHLDSSAEHTSYLTGELVDDFVDRRAGGAVPGEDQGAGRAGGRRGLGRIPEREVRADGAGWAGDRSGAPGGGGMKRVGVDVGGTFTDLILVDEEEGRITVDKVPSTPDDPSRSVVEGVQALCAKAGVALADVDNLLHGTTVATNIVLTHSGAEAGMITTHGFRDIIHIARHKKPFNFSLQQELPWQSRPLVKRRHRLTVQGARHRPGRRRAGRARRRRGARARAGAEGGRRRVGRGLPPALVPQPGARAAHQGDRARGVPGGVPVGLARGAARSTASSSGSRPSP